MSIELYQNLEDVKQDLNKCHQTLATKETNVINNIIQEIKVDFKDFFEGKKFTVTEQGHRLQADYHDLKVKLVLEEPESNGYMGSKYVIELESEGFELGKRIIHIDREVLPSRSRQTKFSTSKPTVEEQIAETTQEINFVKNQIDALATEKWCLFLLPEQYVMGKKPTPYKNITDLLTNVLPK